MLYNKSGIRVLLPPITKISVPFKFNLYPSKGGVPASLGAFHSKSLSIAEKEFVILKLVGGPGGIGGGGGATPKVVKSTLDQGPTFPKVFTGLTLTVYIVAGSNPIKVVFNPVTF